VWQVWLVLVVAFVGYEAYSLLRQYDAHYPFTHWVRRAFDLRRGVRSLGWWAVGGFVAWLGWHLLVAG
jgi:hypothetical protein